MFTPTHLNIFAVLRIPGLPFIAENQWIGDMLVQPKSKACGLKRTTTPEGGLSFDV